MDATADAAGWADVAAWIQREFLPDGMPPIAATTPLISSGLLDSYSVVELVACIEERFDVEVAARWHRLEHLDTLERIARTVERIRQAKNGW